jgi:hypothetical protein
MVGMAFALADYRRIEALARRADVSMAEFCRRLVLPAIGRARVVVMPAAEG